MNSFLQGPLRYIFSIVAILALGDGFASMVMYHEPQRAVLCMILVALCAVVGLLDTIRVRVEELLKKRELLKTVEKVGEEKPATAAAKQDLTKTEPAKKKTPSHSKPKEEPAVTATKEKSSSRTAERFLQDQPAPKKETPTTTDSTHASDVAKRFLKDD